MKKELLNNVQKEIYEEYEESLTNAQIRNAAAQALKGIKEINFSYPDKYISKDIFNKVDLMNKDEQLYLIVTTF